MSLQTILTSFLTNGHNEKQNKCRTLTKRDGKMFITTKKIPNLPYEMMAMILGDTEKQEREEHKKKMFMVLSQLAYIRSGQLDNILSWGELDDDELDRLEEEQDIPDYLAWFPDYALDEGDEDRRKDVFAFPSQQSDWWWRNTGLDRKFCEPFWWLDVVEALNSGSTLAVMKLLE